MNSYTRKLMAYCGRYFNTIYFENDAIVLLKYLHSMKKGYVHDISCKTIMSYPAQHSRINWYIFLKTMILLKMYLFIQIRNLPLRNIYSTCSTCLHIQYSCATTHYHLLTAHIRPFKRLFQLIFTLYTLSSYDSPEIRWKTSIIAVCSALMNNVPWLVVSAVFLLYSEEYLINKNSFRATKSKEWYNLLTLVMFKLLYLYIRKEPSTQV